MPSVPAYSGYVGNHMKPPPATLAILAGITAVAIALAPGVGGGTSLAQTQGSRNKRIQGMQQEASQLINLPDTVYDGLDDNALTALSIRLSDLVGEKVPAPENAAEARAQSILLVAAMPRRVSTLES